METVPLNKDQEEIELSQALEESIEEWGEPPAEANTKTRCAIRGRDEEVI